MRQPESVLREWAQRQPEKPFLLVVCDTFDYEQYPVHCTAEDFAKQIEHYDGKNMQRIEGMFIKAGFVSCGRDGKPRHAAILSNRSFPRPRTRHRISR